MKRFVILCVGLFLLVGLVKTQADGQGIPLPILSSLPTRPLSLDTTISRSEYLKLDLARKTLLGLSFSDSDQVIATQQSQLTDCEQALNQVVTGSKTTIKQLRDSLQSVTRTVQKTISNSQAMSTTVNQAQTGLTRFSGIVKDAKRFVWFQRAGALVVGIGVGVVLPSAIKLIANGL